MANVNAPPYTHVFSSTADDGFVHQKPKIGTTLGCVAGKGRIDMAKLVLNCNALSQYRCRTGYDAAIQEARSKGHLAVADLIYQHSEDFERLDTSPRLSQPSRKWHGFDYNLEDDESSEQSRAEEASISYIDTDQANPSTDFWEGDELGCASSDFV